MTYRPRISSIAYSTGKNTYPNFSNGVSNGFNEEKRSISNSKTSLTEDAGDGRFENGVFIKNHGLNWFVTGLFLVGDLAGGGLVALPTATIQLGIYPGVIIGVIMNIIFMFTAYMLGVSWNILLRRWSEYRSHCRKPYPEIAYRALGPVCRLLVSICIDVTQFGIAVVYLLLSAKNIHDAIKSFSDTNISFCFVVLIVAVCLMPVLFLKSPQDFWWAVVLAMFTTSAAVVLILVGSSLDFGTCHKHTAYPDFKFTNVFLGLGTLLFAYGGHSAFPTIQHDMKIPSQFTRSAILAFAILFFMYTPVCILGYYTYGNALRDSVINSLQKDWIQQAVNLLITIHCILTLTIVFNPLNQEVEEIFNVPQKFGPKRVIIRTGMMVAVVFVAESVPTFGPLLDLMGGSTLTLTSVVFPALFYIFLVAGEKKANERIAQRGFKTDEDDCPVTLKELVKYSNPVILGLCGCIIVFGILGGAAATYSAIHELTSTQFACPCYILPFDSSCASSGSDQSTNCCGVNQTIVAHLSDGIKCSAPKLDFYS
ncbi:hypothetical protein FO519_003835 [Halicephalobus sp. NKZ332]|nr:hypothetical protein FO519_003835 [Halicephalobus sp. NKZ332]